MTQYALKRGKEWICAPAGTDPNARYDSRIFTGDKSEAWTTPSLDVAHERQSLLRIRQGWTTQIQAIKP